MDDVADHAGVSKGSLYGYFKNKDDMFFAAFEWYFERALRDADAVLAGEASARGKLLRLGQHSVTALLDNLEHYPLTFECWAAAGSGQGHTRFAGAMRTVYDRYRRAVETIIRHGQAEGEFSSDLDAPALAATLVGALDGLMLQTWLDPQLEAAAYLETFTAVMFRGMAVPDRMNVDSDILDSDFLDKDVSQRDASRRDTLDSKA